MDGAMDVQSASGVLTQPQGWVSTGPDFVIYLDVGWESRFVKNRQHFVVAELARKLEKRSKILAVERPVCPITTFARRDLRKLSLAFNPRSALRQQSDNLFVFTPFLLIHDRIASYLPGVAALNRVLLAAELRRILRLLNIGKERLVSWIHHPYQSVDIGLVGERALIYDCYDDYLSLSWMSKQRRKRLASLEKKVLKRADIVFVASRKLMEDKRDAVGKVLYVANGADIDHFAKAQEQRTPVAPEIRNLPRPVLGFSGQLSRRVDFSLLAYVAERHQEFSVALVGPSANHVGGGMWEDLHQLDDFRRMKALPNVHLLGEKSYELMPSYLAGFDVCLIPYVQDDFNVASCPLKLYEYMATGKPIVSTWLPEVERYEGLVRVAKTHEEFLAHCEGATAERDAEARMRRVEAARDASWNERVRQMLMAVEEHFAT